MKQRFHAKAEQKQHEKSPNQINLNTQTQNLKTTQKNTVGRQLKEEKRRMEGLQLRLEEQTEQKGKQKKES